jgi:hypothetical protein
VKKIPSSQKQFLFQIKNYRYLIVAIGFISLGFILMVGGGSENPQVFNPEIFSFRRIRVAPTMVLLGFGIAIYSILLNGNKK